MAIFKAGSAVVRVQLDEDCFPNAESVALHGDICVRAVIFEADRRFAILSVDMPSMFENDLTYCRQLLQNAANVAPEDIWITVTHCYSAPHTWDLEGRPGGGRAPKTMEEPAMYAAQVRINDAFRAAYRQAVEGALTDLRPAMAGFGTGSCAINVNRNMHTVDGWWKGVNHDGYTDKTLSVIRVDDLQGAPIAVLYNYSVQITAGAGPIPDAGGRVANADISGVASRYIENEFGHDCAAIFLCGAAGDQVPLLLINYCETDKDGKLREREVSLGMAGFAVVDAQGKLLGNAAAKVAAAVRCTPISAVRTAQRTYTCDCQKREGEMRSKRPTHNYSFIPDGTKELPVYAMLLDDIALVGLLPEMDGITVAEIRERSPYEKAMVAAFVNGNAKSMPQAKSYELLQYTAINSPFAAGSAEQTRDEAVALLTALKEN